MFFFIPIALTDYETSVAATQSLYLIIDFFFSNLLRERNVCSFLCNVDMKCLCVSWLLFLRFSFIRVFFFCLLFEND